ncbi:NYN domain-containing protein [Patescibacteria group bacterium]|nr:NYN domain-containing protein [Patescibacteria group bacterium]MBU4512623.1 NYN domain-containing protein [Patescibacteria group bacterium]MCG2693529.1 NYN domain-containing protein [Candidatus Parcubacteria bacterium]
MKKKAIIFIDGSNFYYRLKNLSKKSKRLKHISLLSFDYRGFCEWLCRDFEIIDIRYYIGAVKRRRNNPKSKVMHANQQKLFRRLQKRRVKVITGQLIQHPDKTYHEKGVDVRIAVEMIRFARLNKYDTAFLISSDTDLVPAVEEVFSFGKKVKYICANERQSFGLTKTAGDYLVLREDDIKMFL